MPIADEKKALRARALAARDAMTGGARASASQAIAERLAALPSFARARSVALFASIGTEVDTRPIERAARANGARTLFPRIVAGEIAFFPCTREELVPAGKWQIPEPPASVTVPGAVDFFVVPGVAFDAAHRRLGYGRGFYDRALAAAPHAPKIAVAFDAQVVDRVPTDERDVAVDAIVTESRLL